MLQVSSVIPTGYGDDPAPNGRRDRCPASACETRGSLDAGRGTVRGSRVHRPHEQTRAARRDPRRGVAPLRGGAAPSGRVIFLDLESLLHVATRALDAEPVVRDQGLLASA